MPTIDEIKRSLPQEKNRYDLIGNTAAYFIARPLSYYLTWVFIKLGISANATSAASTFVAIAACTATAFLNDAWVTVTLVLIWLTLDCVDGNIARVMRTGSKYGEFLDAISGYLLAAFLPLCLALNSSRKIVAVGAIAGMLTLLPRLLLNKTTSLAGSARNSSGDTGSGLLAAIGLSFFNLSGLGLIVLFLAMEFGWVACYLALQVGLGLLATAAAFRNGKVVLTR
jgi:phosphatidylglycerophosphate synthase